jgi:hypothetical protein
MSHHSTADIDPFLSTLPTAPWEAPDPLPVMRREMKLLRIELNLLRTEAQQLALANEEAEKAIETLTASLNQTMASRDHWRREAERLRELVASVPPSWLLWRRCLDAWRAVRKGDGAQGERQAGAVGVIKGLI